MAPRTKQTAEEVAAELEAKEKAPVHRDRHKVKNRGINQEILPTTPFMNPWPHPENTSADQQPES